MRPKLTIGMAHYDDFDGVYFTVQALRMYQDLSDVELIVVDNSPQTQAGKDVKNLIQNWTRFGNLGTRYIPMAESVGTTQPRERIFREAQGESVLVMDCHVLLAPGSIARLKDWYERNPDNEDLLSGPLLYDDLNNISTHFDPKWNAEMWGVWGTDERGRDPDAEPFPIWAQGLGLFTCKKDAWLGFNPHFRGFGGEEGYIHEKFRRAGKQALCLPFLRWAHRFGRPGGTKYPLLRYSKVRNYVLGHQELDMDIRPILDHFVLTQLLPHDQWNYLLMNPVAHESFNADDYRNSRRETKPQPVVRKYETPPKGLDLDSLVKWTKDRSVELSRHFDTLGTITSSCFSVTEFSKCRDSVIALASGRPQRLVSKQVTNDLIFDDLRYAIQVDTLDRKDKDLPYTKEYIQKPAGNALQDMPIENTDLLYLDIDYSADALYAALNFHAPHVNRWIIVRGTTPFGNVAEDQRSPGLLHGFYKYKAENPIWHRIMHLPEQSGLTVFSRDPVDRDIDHGPGTQLKMILASLGIEATQHCDCNTRQMQMNEWGPEKCRENIEEILGWMEEGKERWGYAARIKAASKALLNGLAFKLNPFDPFPGLIEESIRRAEIRNQELIDGVIPY
jgi:hypothetical protein